MKIFCPSALWSAPTKRETQQACKTDKSYIAHWGIRGPRECTRCDIASIHLFALPKLQLICSVVPLMALFTTWLRIVRQTCRESWHSPGRSRIPLTRMHLRKYIRFFIIWICIKKKLRSQEVSNAPEKSSLTLWSVYIHVYSKNQVIHLIYTQACFSQNLEPKEIQ